LRTVTSGDGETEIVAVVRSYRSRGIYVRDLLYELVGRDIKLRYKRSVLGILWSLLNPLAHLIVLVFVFQRVMPLNIPNYSLFAFTGVLAWGWFSAALSAATISIVGNRELIRQPGFPAPILPVVPVLLNLVHFAIAMALLLVVLLLGGGGLTGAVMVLPLVVALQFMVTLSLGYFTATLQVRFHDTSHVLGVVLLLGFFLTPVFYRARAVPEAYQPIYNLNPMAQLITAYRDILIGGQWPDARALLALGAGTAVLLWLGHRTFTRASLDFAEEV
jgi:homopolymeric O-antigen transport system permease protein